MFGYLILINLLLLVSSPEIKDEKNGVQNEDNSVHNPENFAQNEENFAEYEENAVKKEEPIETRTGIPVVISYHKKSYHFPYKAYITTTSQRQEFYYHKEKDGLYYCPLSDTEVNQDPNTGNNNQIEHLKYQYCLVETKFEKKEPKRCKGEVKPIIVEKKDAKGVTETCGSESRLKYKFSYQVCVKKSAMKTFLHFWKKYTMLDSLAHIQHPHTYEICYDHLENRVVYTEHKIMSPYILRNFRLEREIALHDFSQMYSDEAYGIENLKNLQNIFQAYERQTFYDGYRRAFEFQMLTPTIDFALGHWQKTTYHLINYSIQYHHRLDLWNDIITHIRNRIVYDKKNPDIKIFTGTWDILLTKKDEKIYLGDAKELRITIPKYWWKVLYDLNEHKATALIMHNSDNAKRICHSKKEACDILKWIPGLKEKFTEIVYCCDLRSAKRKIKTIDNLGIISADNTRELGILDLN